MSQSKRCYAVIGKGKTGSSVVECLGDRAVTIYSSSNPFNAQNMKQFDAFIVFVPAHGMSALLEPLLEAGRPVVTGVTGFNWPLEKLQKELITQKNQWISASNFSPGMNFMFTVGKLLDANREFLKNPTLSIHEVHHKYKLDSPSGTALSWQKSFLGSGKQLPEITADRVDDVNGIHDLTVAAETEKLFFRHEALSRRAFADGAIYAADVLLPHLNEQNKFGFFSFEDLMHKKIIENIQ